MKPLVKNILIGLSVIAAGKLILLAKSGLDLYDTFQNLKISFKWADNIRIGFKETKFSMDVTIANPTNEDFFIYGDVVATLTKIAIVYQGIELAVADVNFNQIEVPANRYIDLQNIPVVIDNRVLIPYIDATDISGFLAKCSIKGYVQVLGKEYKIGA